jgi:hypothetical protein
MECLSSWIDKTEGYHQEETSSSDKQAKYLHTLEKPKKTSQSKSENDIIQDRNDIEQKVRRIVGTFYLLKDQLEFLKGENEKGRELFRNYMTKRDAAYVMALLQALFSEDDFQKWILFSEYKTVGKKL